MRIVLHVCSDHKFSTKNIPVLIKLNGLVFNLKREIEIERYLPPTCRELPAIIHQKYMTNNKDRIE